MAIGAGLDSPQRVCRERGRGEWEDNVRQIAKAQAFAEEMGVNITFSADSQQPPEEEQPEEVNEVEDESDDKTQEDDD